MHHSKMKAKPPPDAIYPGPDLPEQAPPGTPWHLIANDYEARLDFGREVGREILEDVIEEVRAKLGENGLDGLDWPSLREATRTRLFRVWDLIETRAAGQAAMRLEEHARKITRAVLAEVAVQQAGPEGPRAATWPYIMAATLPVGSPGDRPEPVSWGPPPVAPAVEAGLPPAAPEEPAADPDRPSVDHPLAGKACRFAIEPGYWASPAGAEGSTLGPLDPGRGTLCRLDDGNLVTLRLTRWGWIDGTARTVPIRWFKENTPLNLGDPG